MWLASEILSQSEWQERLCRCRRFMQRYTPEAEGLLVCSAVNIYYFTGTLASGILWIPREGEPVLAVRKGIERARTESPFTQIAKYTSYKDVLNLFAEMGSPFGRVVAVEQQGLTWAQSELLRSRIPACRWLAGDVIIGRTRAVKSPWELRKMELCGARHHKSFFNDLPSRVCPGMSERAIGIELQKIMLENGYMGPVRIANAGDSGGVAVAAGQTGLYPTGFDGPLGICGLHPAAPFWGYEGNVWQVDQPLVIDSVFCLEGYHTDKTQTYWAGNNIPDMALFAYETAVTIQEHAAAMLRPGTLPSEIWNNALQLAEKAHLQEQFMGLGNERVRFLGHGIGLQMDEFPAIAARFDEPLEANMTIALEPKIALPNVGMIGIENTFVVTEHGGKSLTGDDFALLQLIG